ncbi:MAG: GNAT family protein [Cyanobacteriota bacterium]|nr:GNAT family protein [Cyanobacteriota bacterium]
MLEMLPLLVVRPTQLADLAFVLQAEQDPENFPFIHTWTETEHQHALEDSNIAHRIVETINFRQKVGYFIIIGLESSHHNLELRRIVITQKGKGYGKATIKIVKSLAFETYQAHRLGLDVKDHNQRAQAVYRSAGFVVEGIMRECSKSAQADHYDSLLLMSMLRAEYEALQSQSDLQVGNLNLKGS